MSPLPPLPPAANPDGTYDCSFFRVAWYLFGRHSFANTYYNVTKMDPG
jgi:hypothetical protein